MSLYGQNAAVDIANYSFSYGTPMSRSDQVIYRELRLRLPVRPEATETFAIGVTSYTTARVLGRNGPYEMIAHATATVTKTDGTVVFSGQRTASAGYAVVG